MRSWLLAPLLLAVPLAGCVRRSPEPAAPAPALAAPSPARTLWVDASAPTPGDGSAEHPFKSLGQALQAPGRPLSIRLRSGLYAGPFTLPDGTALEGEGQVVLFVEGTETVVTTRGDVRLTGLTVQGGATGIEAEGRLVLDRVQLSGQRRAVVRLASGAVEARGCTFQASVSDTSGLLLEAGTRAAVVDSAFLGPYWRAIHARGVQRVTVDGARFEGPVTGLHQVGGEARVTRTTFTGGRGPALFMARGALTVERTSVKGHEYALQTRQVSPLVVRDFASVSADRAGMGLTETRAELEDVVVVESGPYGGLQLIESDVTARRVHLHRPMGSGISTRGGKLDLREAIITVVREEREGGGNAVELRQTAAQVSGLTVLGAAGICLLAAQTSQVQVQDLWLDRCRWAGVTAETQAQVRGGLVWVSGSPGAAVAVPGDGSVEINRLISEQNADGAVWAECERGAKVRLKGLKEDGPARPKPACVQ